MQTILNGAAVLESASKCDGMCRNNGRVVTMWLVDNHTFFMQFVNNCTRNSQIAWDMHTSHNECNDTTTV